MEVTGLTVVRVLDTQSVLSVPVSARRSTASHHVGSNDLVEHKYSEDAGGIMTSSRAVGVLLKGTADCSSQSSLSRTTWC